MNEEYHAGTSTNHSIITCIIKKLDSTPIENYITI